MLKNKKYMAFFTGPFVVLKAYSYYLCKKR